DPDVPFIVALGRDAVLALVSGGRDFIEKQDLSRLVLAVQREIEEVEARRKRKKSEQDLVTLRAAVDASGEVIFMTDGDGVFTFVNAEFSRLYGYTSEEVLGKTTPRVLKSGETRPEQYAALWATIKNKQVALWEVTNRTKDGRLVNVEGAVNPILDDKGEIAGFLSIHRDVTRRKQLEEQYRQAQKMEAVGRLAGGIAHDFNNLLTVINGYSQMVLEQLCPDHPMHPQIDKIQKAGERAASMTRQLLAFSRQQVLAPQVLNLDKVVAGIDKMLGRLIGEDIELVTACSPGLWHVKADPGQIDQVIMNLAVNARDAMPQGGRLTIETANVTLGEGEFGWRPVIEPGPYVMLAISDTGCGMTPEVKGRIFEPFFTTKECGKGTGLGLSTVYGIVKQSDGYIFADSEPGKGTTFRIYLPPVASAGENRVEKMEPSLRAAGGSETVLVVEDNEAVRSYVRSVLETQGYALLEAGDSKEAVQLTEKHAGPIHLLLADVVMPRMSGPELAALLRPQHPEAKVLYMSGYTDNAIVDHGMLDPGTYFLQKPFVPETLLQKVREILDS
ncbi:MAG TPA: PAS domain S-box protein, partial [Terriglobia bacterium]|nr:PAS domain S-box protein [Terriglobia bacterium]